MVNTGNTPLGRGKGASRIRSQPECASKLEFDKWLVVSSLATKTFLGLGWKENPFCFLVSRGMCCLEVRCAVCGITTLELNMVRRACFLCKGYFSTSFGLGFGIDGIR